MALNKTALVTGVSRGIGRAIAERLLSDGYRVVGTYNNNKPDANVFGKNAGALELLQCDFSKRSDTVSLIESLNDRQFNLLVNNAAVFLPEESNALDMNRWDTTLAVNHTAPMILSTFLMRSMPEGSAVINISSTDAYTGSFSSMAYAASKAALNSVTKSLANIGGARNIRVIGIAPGWINNTGMNSPVSAEAAELSSLQRNGEPAEIAAIVSFLASTNASYITGTTIVADGGYTCVDYIMKKEAQS